MLHVRSKHLHASIQPPNPPSEAASPDLSASSSSSLCSTSHSASCFPPGLSPPRDHQRHHSLKISPNSTAGIQINSSTNERRLGTSVSHSTGHEPTGLNR